MNKKNKIILIICAVVFIASAALLAVHLIPFGDDFDEYKNNSEASSIQSETVEEPELPDNPIDFEKLKEQNSEVVGWISIPDMVIDYPILQSGDNTVEDFYLNKDINKKYKSAGSLYIQKLNYADFSDPNTIIYGHNMLNGTMFGTLKKFRNTNFFNEHDTMYVYIPEHILTYKIYSAFIYDDRHILNSFEFYNRESYAEFLAETLDPMSMTRNVRKDIEVTTENRIITLSTCTNRDTERYLVIGVLVNDELTK